MDTVIITGASGEPAQSIAARLCGTGIRVYALAGTFPETRLGRDEFVPVRCDMTSPESVADAVRSVLEKEKHVVGIILAGQYLSEESFEAVSPEEIRLALNARVVSPLCAVRLALPSLIAARGHVVVLSPGAGNTEGRALNAVADAAVRAFAGTLFAELRDTGVKTCHILLQNNDGAPDPAALFTTVPQSRIHAEIVADAVETVFRLRENNALTQMVLRPQATRETPRIPISSEPKIRSLQIVQLPPKKNFPPEEEPIPTPAYRRPDYAPAKKERDAGTEDDGFSDDYVDPELSYLVKPAPQTPAKPKLPKPPKAPKPRVPAEADANADAVSPGENPADTSLAETPTTQNPPSEGKNRRRNRNRNRDKKRNANGAIRINAPQVAPTPENPPQTQKKPPEASSEKSVPAPENSEKKHVAKRKPRVPAKKKPAPAKSA